MFMFVIGNMSMLEYKTKEEVVYVLYTAHTILLENLSEVKKYLKGFLNSNFQKVRHNFNTRYASKHSQGKFL